MILIDSLFYNKLVIAPWNIISYNIFSNSGGPGLYGTEPWHYYILNGLLNFNIAFALALVSGPVLILTRLFAYKQLGGPRIGVSNFTLLAFRLAPFYLWFAVLSSQAHKEERFMFAAHALLCFNAATALYLTRGWVERVYLRFVKDQKVSLAVEMPCQWLNRAGLTGKRLVSVYDLHPNHYHLLHPPFSITHRSTTLLLSSTYSFNGASQTPVTRTELDSMLRRRMVSLPKSFHASRGH